jgi:hypothetical protein
MRLGRKRSRLLHAVTSIEWFDGTRTMDQMVAGQATSHGSDKRMNVNPDSEIISAPRLRLPVLR